MVAPQKPSKETDMGTKKGKKGKNEESGGRVKKLLPVQIDERAKRAKEAEIRELLTANTDLKEKAKPFNDKRKQNTEKIEKLRGEAESLTEEREVTCEVIYDFAHRVKKFRRLDTKKLVPELEETMQDGDREENLFTDRKGKPRKAKAPKPGTPEEQAAGEAAHDEAMTNGAPATEDVEPEES